MKRKYRLICLILCIMSTCVACGKKVELEDKCFVATIGIDVGDDIKNLDRLKEIKSDEPFQEREIKKFSVTYGYPDMGQLGPGKSAIAETKTINTQAFSMQNAMSMATAKSSRKIYFGHSKLLVISAEVMFNEELIREISDYLQRNPEINRSMNVVCVEGKAEEYIKFKPDMENNIEFYLEGLMKNAERNATIFKTDLNDILVKLSENGNVLIPRLHLDTNKKELLLKGVYVIKEYMAIGKLDEIETGDVNLLRGKVEGLSKVVYLDGHSVDFTIDGTSKRMKIKRVAKDKLDIDINLEVEGVINGYYSKEGDRVSDHIEELQKSIDKSLSEECQVIATNIQQAYKIDPFKIKEHLMKFRPFIWKEIKHDWEQIYCNSDIHVNITTKIRRIGTID